MVFLWFSHVCLPKSPPEAAPKPGAMTPIWPTLPWPAGAGTPSKLQLCLELQRCTKKKTTWDGRKRHRLHRSLDLPTVKTMVFTIQNHGLYEVNLQQIRKPCLFFSIYKVGSSKCSLKPIQ